MEVSSAWSITLPGSDHALVFTRAEPGRHTDLLYDWLHRPHVAPWWGEERNLSETGSYIERQLATGHLTPWVVSADDLEFGYVETYRAAEDPLADAHPLRASDRGWHVLVGPAEVLGRGLPRLMGRAVLAHLLSEPGVDRVVCEPDERNARMLRFCEVLGHERLATLDLGHKRAALLACTRDRFDALWPGDLEAGTKSWSKSVVDGDAAGLVQSEAGSEDGGGS